MQRTQDFEFTLRLAEAQIGLAAPRCLPLVLHSSPLVALFSRTLTQPGVSLAGARNPWTGLIYFAPFGADVNELREMKRTTLSSPLFHLYPHQFLTKIREEPVNGPSRIFLEVMERIVTCVDGAVSAVVLGFRF